MSKAAVIACFAGMGAYTYYISGERELKPRIDQNFAVGSAEERLLFQLKTGDVVLFDRKWQTTHIPAAILITLYKRIFDTRFDHCGVVVQDNSGVYWLSENTMFGGLKMRPLEARIINSLSEHLVVVPMRPNIELTNEERRKFMQLMKNVTQKNPYSIPIQCMGILEGVVFHCIKKFFPSKHVESWGFDRRYVCPSMQHVSNSLLLLNKVINEDEIAQNETTSSWALETPMSYCNLNCGDVHCGKFFDQYTSYSLSVSKNKDHLEKNLRRKGQAYNSHITFR